jgi:hypothetical protein
LKARLASNLNITEEVLLSVIKFKELRSLNASCLTSSDGYAAGLNVANPKDVEVPPDWTGNFGRI